MRRVRETCKGNLEEVCMELGKGGRAYRALQMTFEKKLVIHVTSYRTNVLQDLLRDSLCS